MSFAAKSRGRIRPSAFPVVLALMANLPLTATAEEEHLPTPYTAEQIRDGSPAGLEVVTRVTTPEGVRTSVGKVVESTAEAATFTDQALDDAGDPVGEASRYTATWEELRRHALFPASLATRERTSPATALGELEGWLYTLRSADESDAVTTLFFADAYPGAPVVFERTRDGELLMRAEQIERRGG